MADLVPQNFPVRLEGNVSKHNIVPIGAVVRESLGRPGGAELEFVSDRKDLDINDLLGQSMHLVIDTPDGTTRAFRGFCVEVFLIDAQPGKLMHYGATLRPAPWFLSRTTDCRIFQEMTAPDIIKALLKDAGLAAQDKLGGSYRTRAYCTQYRETTLDFIHRLMEEEGIYYYMDSDSWEEKMILCDASTAHPQIAGKPTLRFVPRDDDDGNLRVQFEHLFHWAARHRVRSGRVVLDDYNYETTSVDLLAKSEIASGDHPHAGHELYDYPGRYGIADDGDHYARVRMEAEAATHRSWQGRSNAPHIVTGRLFKIDGSPDPADDGAEFLVTEATHHVLQDLGRLKVEGLLPGVARRLGLASSEREPYHVSFVAMRADTPYRRPATTPMPRIPGPQTAVVTGPSGEEIYTDNMGRIRLQFHWDRLGKSDENSTRWVRVMTPSAGAGWGMIHIPRIGQEVVVQYEEGDPDRPLVVGMVYNDAKKQPYSLPDQMNLSGFRSRSTKSGGKDNYNELVFDDTKDAELVRLHAERDYLQVVENDATIEIGREDKDPGDMSLTVHRNLKEFVKTGDHTFRVETGSQDLFVKTDKTEQIEGKSDSVVTGNVTETVEQGNVTRTVKMGNVKHEVQMGNVEEELQMGNYSQKLALGKATHEAMQSIEFKVGSSSVKIDQMGVTIKGMMVKIEADVMLQAKGLMTDVKGDAMLKLKGGITLIN